MSTDTLEAPEPQEPDRSAAQRARRRRNVWRVLLAALLGVVLFALYGGFLVGGGASAPRKVRTPLQSLRYPSAFGAARTSRISDAYERIQIAGFGEEPGRGPRAALQAVLKLTRAGGLLFEARSVASEGERDYLLRQRPYACATRESTELVRRVAGVEVRRVVRGVLFRWLPSSVTLCGTRVDAGVLRHVSGFATEATWQREGEALARTVREWRVNAGRLPHEAGGCRMNVERDPPLYVQFRDEAAAQQGVVDAQTVRWIDLPYEREESVGRFTPQRLQTVSRHCAEAQARFAQVVQQGRSPEDAEAQVAQHAFRARCEPLFPTLRYLGAEQFSPDALPRPLDGWSYTLADDYVPAMCLPLRD